MFLYKCKMCGCSLDAEPGQATCTCGNCGTSQTMPVSVSEQINDALSHGNELRRDGEFERAAALYENLLEHVHKDPEIYWQLALCRYGITYVKNQDVNAMIPECRRIQYKSILCDAAYLEAVNRSDLIRRDAYRKEAEYIDVMQKKLLKKSSEAEYYQIFLCSAGKNKHGKASADFIFAREIYSALTKKGYRVFFPPITLGELENEEKEPFIFAALNSSEVMIPVGVQYENINSRPVREQWKRFAALAETDDSKRMMPVVKGMKLRSLPKALTGYPGMEISSSRDIEKLIKNINNNLGDPSESNYLIDNDLNTDDLIRRGHLCLEKRKWALASGYFDRAEMLSPDDSAVYRGKLLVECGIESAEQISELGCDLSFSNNYRRAIRLGDKELEDLGRKSLINRSVSIMNSARSIQELAAARQLLSRIEENSDTQVFFAECSRRIEEHKESEYLKACEILENSLSLAETENARNIFIELENYKDSPQKVQDCTELIIRNDYARENSYQKAYKIMTTAEFHSNYDEAIGIFTSLDDYKDSIKLAKKCRKKRRLLSLTFAVKLILITGICWAVPHIIEKI